MAVLLLLIVVELGCVGLWTASWSTKGRREDGENTGPSLLLLERTSWKAAPLRYSGEAISCVSYFTCVRVSVGGVFVYGVPYSDEFYLSGFRGFCPSICATWSIWAREKITHLSDPLPYLMGVSYNL